MGAKNQKRLCVGLILLWFLSTAFSLPEIKRPQLPPYVKYRLSKLPLVGRFVEPPPPPEKAYLETQELIKALKKAQADRYLPEAYAEILRKWERAQEYYRTGHYDWAEDYFQRIQKLAQEALQKAQGIREENRRKALTQLQKLRKSFEKRKKQLSFEERLKLELVLWRLETVIEMEDFERFASEAEEVRKTYGL